MRQECRERFPHHRLQRKQLVSDPGMHHGMCVTHVSWCMSGSLTHGGGENAPRHSWRMRNPQFYVSVKRPTKRWNVINHPCPNFNSGLIKTGLMLGQGWLVNIFKIWYGWLYLSMSKSQLDHVNNMDSWLHYRTLTQKNDLYEMKNSK